MPPKVEYTLTPLGLALGPLLDSMGKWGQRVIDGRWPMRARHGYAETCDGRTSQRRPSLTRLVPAPLRTAASSRTMRLPA